MSKDTLSIIKNTGGWATDLKEGVPHSFAYSRHIDFRKSPTLLSILPKMSKESGSTVTALITDMIQLPSGKMVAIDEAGGVYVRNTAGVWSKDGTSLPDTAAGMLYHPNQDTIYVPGLNNMHAIKGADDRFTGSVFTVDDNVFTANVDQSATDSSSTYTTLGAIDEGSANKLSVVPTVEPMASVKVWVTTKGSANLRLTMHDAANNKLAEVDLANGSIANGALNEFTFSLPVRNTVKPNASTYHFHLTHPSGTAHTIGCGTANELSTARFETYANRFINPVNNFHPGIQFLQYMLFGNERYVSAWEPISQSAPANTEFLRHRVVLEPGFEVTSMGTWTDYVAIAAELRSTSATNEFQQGKIYFWDGFAAGWNFAIDIPEGAPYSLFSHKNVLRYFAGGTWWAWAGGRPAPIFQMPGTDSEYTDASQYIVNNPHMMAVRNSILLGGFPSETSSTSIEHGIYSFGSRNKNYDESFGYSYTMSTGNRTNGTLRIGMVKSFGDKLFMSWRDDTSYGVDKVDPSSDPNATATWESLIMDFGRPDKQKEAVSMVMTFKALPAGCTITPKYKIDREASWQSDTSIAQGVTGNVEVTLPLGNKRFKEIQLGFDAVAGAITPEIISTNLTVEFLQQEAE